MPYIKTGTIVSVKKIQGSSHEKTLEKYRIEVWKEGDRETSPFYIFYRSLYEKSAFDDWYESEDACLKDLEKIARDCEVEWDVPGQMNAFKKRLLSALKEIASTPIEKYLELWFFVLFTSHEVQEKYNPGRGGMTEEEWRIIRPLNDALKLIKKEIPEHMPKDVIAMAENIQQQLIAAGWQDDDEKSP